MLDLIHSIQAPSTTTTSTTTSTVTTTTTSCTGQGVGSLLSVSGSIGWTYYSHNYTATVLAPVLQFAVQGGPAAETVYLDDVSVVAISQPTIQLLNNPSFEMSTSSPIDWVMWCTSSCVGSGDGGHITTSGCHNNSGNNCYTSHCQTGFNFLGQSFSAVVGTVYKISFWYYKTGGGAGKLYVDMV
ncbi:unnamed protein product [Adineta steineri]|uniref:Uncharacterized protein n=1 Tax=Adineta steineri TaxID=433720 RepID=A0A814CGY7_9BILA|nr:unnamed protein product [Adineta steineri]CAF4016717.1 unnamed protein product [Adineta steineri]